MMVTGKLRGVIHGQLFTSTPVRFLFGIDKPRFRGDDPLESVGDPLVSPRPPAVEAGGAWPGFLLIVARQTTDGGVSPWTGTIPTAAWQHAPVANLARRALRAMRQNQFTVQNQPT